MGGALHGQSTKPTNNIGQVAGQRSDTRQEAGLLGSHRIVTNCKQTEHVPFQAVGCRLGGIRAWKRPGTFYNR
jgi:hypothetical protein